MYDEHEYHMLPVTIKESYTELHLFIHPVSSLVGTTVSVSFTTRDYLECLEKESSWFCWFWEPLLIRLRLILLDVSSQYRIAKCTCMILLCDGYIHLLNSKGE